MPGPLGHRVKSRMSLFAEGDDVAEATDGAEVVRKKFDEFKVGDEVDAVVIRKDRFGIWCGISAENTVLLDEPRKLSGRLRLYEKVKAKIKKIDLEKRQATVGIPGLEELVQDRSSKPKKAVVDGISINEESLVDGMKITQGANWVAISGLDVAGVDVDKETGIVKIRLKSETSGSEAAPAEMKPQEGKQEKQADPEAIEALKKMEVGQVLSGKVVNKNRLGVWVDIGSAVKPKLLFSDELLGNKLRFGEELKLKVVEIDVAKGRCSAEVEDIETLVAGRELKEVSTLEVGSEHMGHVASITRAGVFVDIECVKEGILLKRSRQSYQLGQEVNVKVASVNLEKGQFDLELVTA